MKTNPYVASTLKGRDLSELRANDGSKLVGRNGELNASSNADLLKQISAFLATVASGGGEQNQELVTSATKQRAENNRKALMAAFADPTQHKVLGETMSEDLYVSSNYEGFARRFLAVKTLVQGQIPRVAVRQKNVQAVVAASQAKIQSQLIRDNIYLPPEFYIQTRPFVAEIDIQQSVEDLLEEKFVEATEGVMVAEDRLWYKMAKAAATVLNDKMTLVGQLTPTALMDLRNQVGRWRIPTANLLIANDIWTDIVGNSDFAQIVDPVSKAELLLTGKIGTLFEMDIVTDAYRHENHRVTNKGDMFVVGAPINHGTMTDRGGVTSTPIDVSHEGNPGRGWHFVELVSMIIANAKSVAYGTRV